MSSLQSLSDQWNDVAARIGALGPMRSGSVCRQTVKYRAKDGTEKANGPYPILTFKHEDNKTRTVRLRSAEQAQIAQDQIDNFRQFQELTRQLVRIGREMADLELAGKTEGKKNSSNASKPSRKKKRRRSSNA